VTEAEYHALRLHNPPSHALCFHNPPTHAASIPVIRNSVATHASNHVASNPAASISAAAPAIESDLDSHVLRLHNPPLHALCFHTLPTPGVATHVSNPAAPAIESDLDSEASPHSFVSIPTEELEMEFLAGLVVVTMIRRNSAGVTTAHDNFTGFVSRLLEDEDEDDKSNSNSD
jgi:hypothetical protein